MHGVAFLFVASLIAAEGRSIKELEKKSFELDDYLKGDFSAKSFNGSWLTGDTFLYKNPEGDVLKFDLQTLKSDLFLNNAVLKDYPGATIRISHDQKYVLLRYDVSSVFRHSTTARFTIYDILNQKYHDLANKEHSQIAQWAPVGHGLVYVFKNNIFYLREPSSTPIPITSDGLPGIIYNGVPDWVYEEEVLGTGSALWFSPDGNHLAYASFNDENVKEFDYFIYGNPGTLKDQYPQIARIKYPKVGTPNPTVKTFVANLQSTTMEIQELDKAVPEHLLNDTNDYVLYDITWPTNNEIALILTNRVQNEGYLVRCTISNVCTTEATYKEPNGWLDIKIPKYSKDGTQRVEIVPQPEEDDFFDHLVLTTIASNVTSRLTKGKFVVTGILGWDETTKLIYFAGSGEKSSSQQHVYVVSTEDGTRKCLTCEINTSSGLCRYASGLFSTDLSHWVAICQGPGPYLVAIYKTQDNASIVWEDNDVLIEKLSHKLQPVIKDIEVPVENGFVANVRLLLPPDLDITRKYPAVVNVYAGPNSNRILDTYSAGFEKYIVTNRKYIYIFIDGRGSGRNGQKKMFQVYRQLGTAEIRDQISVTKYLQDHLPFIDRNNTGIWGWSYGGFATAWALVQDKEAVFKFGLSVAPVTSFIYYDSIYTERYMGLPTEEDNLGGYNNTDVTRNAEDMRGKLFFLIHGNGDDNVHYQQSMLLSRALELADVPFRQQSYPDENHSLGHVSAHLYHTIDRFWARSFNLPDPVIQWPSQEDTKNEHLKE